MNRKVRLLPLLFMAVFLAACTTPTATPDITADVPDIPTSTFEPSGTPSPTCTPMVSPTPSATFSPTPSPTPEPEEHQLQIAYIDGDAYLWTEDDGVIPLTQSAIIYDLRLSPDGQHLAYSRLLDSDQVELRLVSTDGSDDRLLVSLQDLDELVPNDEPVGIFSFKWLSNGHYLAFNTHIIGYGLWKNDDLHLVNIDTGSIATLLPAGQGGDFYYSPDGEYIALVTSGDYMDLPGEISLVKADGNDRYDALVSFPSVLTYSEVPFYPPLAWSPDSSFFLVAIPSPDPFAMDASITVWRINANDPLAEELFTTDTSFFLSGLPIFSPNLSQVAYRQSLGDPDDPWANLYIYHVETSEHVLYYEGPLDYFAWIPDTDHFVFVSGDPLLILGHMEETPQPTELAWVGWLVWVDAQRFLSVERSQDDGETQVYLNTLDGERQFLFLLTSRFLSVIDINN